MSARDGGGRRFVPYLIGLPGGMWLAIFFVIPILVMLSLSLQSGNAEAGFRFTWEWANNADAWEFYHTQFVRSIIYGLIVTVLCLVLAYPMAYWIAFYGGRRKSTYLFLILLPFFVSFVIRTASWKFILADEGIVLGPLKDAGLLPSDFHILATSTAVIGGLTYNYLPFMVLPLSLPGVFAGVLITFVPVTSDFVNNGILGGTQTTMIGNVIQTQYLTYNEYPLAAAMSFILMAALLVGIFAYARTLGTEQVLEVSQL